MTLTEQFRQQLSSMAPFSAGEQAIEVTAPAQRLYCRLVALDTLACAFTRLALAADSLQNMPTEGLKQIAQRLSARLTYLLEPISPIETDAEGCVVQMRSSPPQKDTDRTSYYELLVSRSGELSLSRYARAVGQPREIIPAQLTREVLLRLVSDFSSVVSS